MTGPFDTEAEVRALPEVQAVYDAFDADPGIGKMAPHIHRLLCEALTAAGVELGSYDHRIAVWLAGWEPQTVAVIAGWIERAHRPAPAATANLDDDQAAIVPEAPNGGQELNATAKATLASWGISPAEWARTNGYADGRWYGDACGCPDDRCIGYHHDGPDDCGCLQALLERPADDEPEPEDYDPGPEVDDEGGMSEYRNFLAAEEPWS